MQTRFQKLREQSLAVRAAVLASALVAACLLLAIPAWHFAGPDALVSATLAGFSCLVGFLLALAASEPARRTGRMLHGMLWAMTFRMGVPLAAALLVVRLGGGAVQAGFLGWLVAFFEFGLVVEVFLSLPPASRGHNT